MAIIQDAGLSTNLSAIDATNSHPDFSYPDYVVGAAIFDLNGLPKEYFTTAENNNISWVQTIFQALGLRSLLTSSLQLEGFHHAIIQGAGYCAVVVRQNARYTALLLRRNAPINISDRFWQWLQELEPQVLKANARFRLA